MHIRGGFTLLELIVASAAAAFLLAGLGSVLFIARQSLRLEGPVAATLDATRALDELHDELAWATHIAQRGTRAIEFVTPDRDGDGLQDTIRYEWSGVAGEPLLKTVNRGQPIAVAQEVNAFALDFDVATKDESIPTTEVGAETTLASHTDLSDVDDLAVTSVDWTGQSLHGANFAGRPGDALDWTATRVAFRAKTDGAATGSFWAQLRPAGGDGKPTSEILGQTLVQESSLSGGHAWRSVAFDPPIENLSLSSGYCLVYQWASGQSAARIQDDNDGNGTRLKTTNAGGSWSFFKSTQGLYELYGTYTTPGEPLIVTRSYLLGVRTRLALGEDSAAELRSGTRTFNNPELLSGYWHSDFDGDPTATDNDGDGASDWETPGGGFDRTELVNGVWYAEGDRLETRPATSRPGTLTAEVRFRDTIPGGEGAVLTIEAGEAGGSFVPLTFQLQLQGDGTQTLSLAAPSGAGTPRELFRSAGLTDGFVLLRLVADPESALAAVFVEGIHQGTYDYDSSPTGAGTVQAAVESSDGSAEFDYVSVRVSEAPDGANGREASP